MHDARLIDGTELKKRIESTICYGCEMGHIVTPCGKCYVSIVLRYIDEMPTIDAQPVKRGHWIDVDYKTIEHGFIETYPNEGVCCSECRTGFKKSRQLIRNFCPNCGARMDGGDAK